LAGVAGKKRGRERGKKGGLLDYNRSQEEKGEKKEKRGFPDCVSRKRGGDIGGRSRFLNQKNLGVRQPGQKNLLFFLRPGKKSWSGRGEKRGESSSLLSVTPFLGTTKGEDSKEGAAAGGRKKKGGRGERSRWSSYYLLFHSLWRFGEIKKKGKDLKVGDRGQKERGKEKREKGKVTITRSSYTLPKQRNREKKKGKREKEVCSDLV